MNVEFFFHGVPAAFSQWGTTAIDSDSMQRFYANFESIQEDKSIQKDIRFVIEVSRIGDIYCVYYSYLRYKNFIDQGGRTGSYFGMTIRFDDEYCKNVRAIYNICESIYVNQICGNVITRQGNSSRYLIRNFEDKNVELTDICHEALIKISQLAYAPISPVLLPNTPSQHPLTPLFNIQEIESEYFWISLKNASTVRISPEYPLRDTTIQQIRSQIEPERQRSEQLSIENSRLKRERDVLMADCGTMSTTIENLRRDKSDLENKLNELKRNLDNFLNEQNKGKKQKRIEQIITQIKNPIEDLSSILKSMYPNSKDTNKKIILQKNKSVWLFKKIYKWITKLLGGGIILMLIWLCYFQYIATNRILQMDNELSLWKQEEKSNNTEANIDFSSRRIDIKISGIDNSGQIDTLKNGKTYTLSIVKTDNHEDNISKEGYFAIIKDCQFEIIKGNKYTVKTDKTSQVLLVFIYNGKSIERSIHLAK